MDAPKMRNDGDDCSPPSELADGARMAEPTALRSAAIDILEEMGPLDLRAFVAEYKLRTGKDLPYGHLGRPSPYALIRFLAGTVKFEDGVLSLTTTPRSFSDTSSTLRCSLGTYSLSKEPMHWSTESSSELPVSPALPSIDPSKSSERLVSPLYHSTNTAESSDLPVALKQQSSDSPEPPTTSWLRSGIREPPHCGEDVQERTVYLCESSSSLLIHLGPPNSETSSPVQKQEHRLPLIIQQRHIPDWITRNIEGIAVRHPKGICEEDFLRQYQSQYWTELDPTEFGFVDLVDMLLDCSCVGLVQSEEGFTLFPKTAPVKLEAPHEFIPMGADMLKPLWKDDYDEDECDPLYRFAPPEFPEEWEPVEITDGYSCGDFWIRCGKHKLMFNEFMDDLNDYYNYDVEWPDHQLPDNVIIGTPVAAFWFDEWARAVINKVINPNTFELFFPDYGTLVPEVKRDRIRKLHKQFGKMQMIALRAVMWNVKPANDTGEWLEDSYRFIYDDWALIKLRMKIVKSYTEVLPIAGTNEVPKVEAIFFSDRTSGFKNVYMREVPRISLNLNHILVLENIGAWIDPPDEEEMANYQRIATKLQKKGLEEMKAAQKPSQPTASTETNTGSSVARQDIADPPKELAVCAPVSTEASGKTSTKHQDRTNGTWWVEPLHPHTRSHLLPEEVETSLSDAFHENLRIIQNRIKEAHMAEEVRARKGIAKAGCETRLKEGQLAYGREGIAKSSNASCSTSDNISVLGSHRGRTRGSHFDGLPRVPACFHPSGAADAMLDQANSKIIPNQMRDADVPYSSYNHAGHAPSEADWSSPSDDCADTSDTNITVDKRLAMSTASFAEPREKTRLLDRHEVDLQDTSDFIDQFAGTPSTKFAACPTEKNWPNLGNLPMAVKTVRSEKTPASSDILAIPPEPPSADPSIPRGQFLANQEESAIRFSAAHSPSNPALAVVAFPYGETFLGILTVKVDGRFSMLKDDLLELVQMVNPASAEYVGLIQLTGAFEVSVTRRSNMTLWRLLLDHDISSGKAFHSEKEYVLVPLERAAQICKSLDPTSAQLYDETFAVISKRLMLRP